MKSDAGSVGRKPRGCASKLLVSVRLRPVITEDVQQATLLRNAPEVCVHLKNDGQTIKLVQDHYNSKHFKVDHTFDASTSQQQVYDTALKPVVRDVVAGFNGTGIVYGQTGSGKTHTMFGSEGKTGLANFALIDVFQAVEALEDDGLVAKVFMGFYQIYTEQIYDLLADCRKGLPPALAVREDATGGTYVEDLTTLFVKDRDVAFQIVKKGLQNRRVQSTACNFRSSRSHAVLQVTLDFEERSTDPFSASTVAGANATTTGAGVDERRYSVRRRKLVLVDLAGSERVPTYKHASKQHMKEAFQINKSISALGNCICALSNQEISGDASHVPYRDTKLTRLLAESLGGNSKTALICTVGPCTYHFDETKCTLKFASRAKVIRKPVQKAVPEEVVVRPRGWSFDPLATGGSGYNSGGESVGGSSVRSSGGGGGGGAGGGLLRASSRGTLHADALDVTWHTLDEDDRASPARELHCNAATPVPTSSSPTSAFMRSFLSPGAGQQLHISGSPETTFSLRDFLRACTLANKAFDAPNQAGGEEVVQFFSRSAEQNLQSRRAKSSAGAVGDLSPHSPEPRDRRPEPSPWPKDRSALILRDPESPSQLSASFLLASSLPNLHKPGYSDSSMQTVSLPAGPASRRFDGSLDDFTEFRPKSVSDQEVQTDPLLLPDLEDDIIAEEVRQYQIDLIAQRNPSDLATQMWTLQQQLKKKEETIRSLTELLLDI